MTASIEVFLCYARQDEDAMKALATHLGVLRRQGFLKIWHDQQISAGSERALEIDAHLTTAKIILLLISQYFMDSDYCYCYEMSRAIERHSQGKARVIPVILRPVFYQKAPFAKLQPLPRNQKPVLTWSNMDEAFFDVAEGVRLAIEDLNGENEESWQL